MTDVHNFNNQTETYKTRTGATQSTKRTPNVMWDRSEECYVFLEDSLFKQVEYFSKKSNKKLRESCNLFTPPQFAKDGNISWVIILGTTKRITLQVQRFLFNLQKKRLFLGRSNDQQHHDLFLLFSVMDFVKQQTTIRNYLSSSLIPHTGKASRQNGCFQCPTWSRTIIGLNTLIANVAYANVTQITPALDTYGKRL